MANLLEVLLTSDLNNSLWTCSVWDPNTGTNLMNYKVGGTAESNTVSFLGNDYLALVERGKPLLHIWPLNSHQTVQGMRFVLPGKASALAFTQDGSYCVAGIDEKLFIWQISSGSLLTIINRHYQKIVILKFTPDGRHFVSGAEDGMVMVWALTTVVAHPEVELVTQSTAGQHDPMHIFSDHSLPVTGLYVSKTGVLGRVCTASMDRTCKIYDISTGEMLLNMIFDVPLTAVTMDVLELNVFIGCNDGNIVQFSITDPPRTRDHCVNNKDHLVFAHHSKAVTCLSVSLDGERLMSGSNDENVILWHINSRQPIRTIKHKGAITNAFFTKNFPSIYKEKLSPNIILHTLQRTLERNSDDIYEIEVLTTKNTNFWHEPLETNVDNSFPSTETEVELTYNDSKLKDELRNLKKINSEIYAFSINKLMETNSNPNVDVRKKKKKNKQ